MKAQDAARYMASVILGAALALIPNQAILSFVTGIVLALIAQGKMASIEGRLFSSSYLLIYVIQPRTVHVPFLIAGVLLAWIICRAMRGSSRPSR